MHMTSQISESNWHQVGSKRDIADLMVTQLSRRNVLLQKVRLALIVWAVIIALLYASVQNISGSCPPYESGRKLSCDISR